MEIRVVLEEDGYTVGLLQVPVQQIAPGSESQYLPEAYKPLFHNPTYRRPAFDEARKRLAQTGRGGKEGNDDADDDADDDDDGGDDIAEKGS